MDDESRRNEFVAFCVEMYAQACKLSGGEAMKRLDACGLLDSLRDNYDVLHTQGREYLVQSMNETIAKSERR